MGDGRQQAGAAVPQELIVRVLDVAQPSAFEEMLRGLMSNDNAMRTNAESVLEACGDHAEQLAHQLVQLLRRSEEESVRSICAVLLRKKLGGPEEDDDGLWKKLTPNFQEGVKSELLNAIKAEPSLDITRKICDTVGVLGGPLLCENSWPQLLQFLFQSMQSGDNRLMEGALIIFSQLVTVSVTPLVPHLGSMHQMLQQLMCGTHQGTSCSVKVAAIGSTVSLLDSLESDEHRMQFQPLVPSIVNTIGAMLQAGEEEDAQSALRSLIEIAEDHPTLLRKTLVETVNGMLQVVEATNLEDDTRRLGAEFLVSLTEAHDKAPGMMRKLNKQTNFVQKFIASMMDFLLDIDDESEWYSNEADEGDEPESEKYRTAQECLDRIALNLGGKSTLEASSGIIQSYMGDADWAKRHAALVAIAQIAEGCSKIMSKNLPSVATPCLNAFRDQHPRVRWAAVNCIGQLCTDLGPALQKELHEQILGALMHAMEDFENHRVQAHAASALVNFSESCPQKILAPYMDVLVGKLLQLLQSGKRIVQEATLTALASIADTAQDAFVKFYDSVIPYLKTILRDAKDKTHRMLRAKAMECTSLIGMAVGRDRFMPDAREVMELLLSLQTEKQEDDDMTASYMLQAWARLCKTLGQDFLPYLDTVMGPLLEAASSSHGFSVIDANENADDDDDDEVQTIEIGDKVIAIRTAALEEKATACSMLCCYADELKEGFWPYVERSLKILVPLLKYFHEDVRKAAVSAMPEMFRSAQLAVEKGMVPDPTMTKKVLDFIIGPLVESIESETDDMEILSHKMEMLAEICGDGGDLLSEQQLMGILKLVDQILRESAERRDELRVRSQSAEFDEEDKEFLAEEQEQEQELCTNAVETVSGLLKKLGTRLLPFLDSIFPILAKYLGADADEADRLMPIGLFSDVIEFANADGVAGSRYIEPFLPILLECCNPNVDVDLRQTSAYALGVCAQYGGQPFEKFTQKALEAVGTLCGAPDSREGDNESPTDNAVSTLGKIAEYRGNLVDRNAVLAAWLRMLPLRADVEEARHVHEHLCAMVERGEAALVGNAEKLPEIISVFADVLATRTARDSEQLATSEVMVRMVKVVKMMQANFPADTMSAVWAGMRPEQQQSLQDAMALAP